MVTEYDGILRNYFSENFEESKYLMELCDNHGFSIYGDYETEIIPLFIENIQNLCEEYSEEISEILVDYFNKYKDCNFAANLLIPAFKYNMPNVLNKIGETFLNEENFLEFNEAFVLLSEKLSLYSFNHDNIFNVSKDNGKFKISKKLLENKLISYAKNYPLVLSLYDGHNSSFLEMAYEENMKNLLEFAFNKNNHNLADANNALFYKLALNNSWGVINLAIKNGYVNELNNVKFEEDKEYNNEIYENVAGETVLQRMFKNWDKAEEAHNTLLNVAPEVVAKNLDYIYKCKNYDFIKKALVKNMDFAKQKFDSGNTILHLISNYECFDEINELDLDKIDELLNFVYDNNANLFAIQNNKYETPLHLISKNLREPDCLFKGLKTKMATIQDIFGNSAMHNFLNYFVLDEKGVETLKISLENNPELYTLPNKDKDRIWHYISKKNIEILNLIPKDNLDCLLLKNDKDSTIFDNFAWQTFNRKSGFEFANICNKNPEFYLKNLKNSTLFALVHNNLNKSEINSDEVCNSLQILNNLHKYYPERFVSCTNSDGEDLLYECAILKFDDVLKNYIKDYSANVDFNKTYNNKKLIDIVAENLMFKSFKQIYETNNSLIINKTNENEQSPIFKLISFARINDNMQNNIQLNHLLTKIKSENSELLENTPVAISCENLTSEKAYNIVKNFRIYEKFKIGKHLTEDEFEKVVETAIKDKNNYSNALIEKIIELGRYDKIIEVIEKDYKKSLRCVSVTYRVIEDELPDQFTWHDLSIEDPSRSPYFEPVNVYDYTLPYPKENVNYVNDILKKYEQKMKNGESESFGKKRIK